MYLMQNMDSPIQRKTAEYTPTIRTKRLTMTLYDKEKDKLFLADLWNSYADSSPDTFIWLPDMVDRLMRNTILSPETCNGMEAPGPSTYIVHLGDENGTKIGQIQLSERLPTIPPDFGYGILPPYRRQGFATEAAVAVLHYWRHVFGLTSISGFCLPTNTQSNAMLVKLGFEYAGNALLNGTIVINGYVLPGMEHFSTETCRLSRWGVEKGNDVSVRRT